MQESKKRLSSKNRYYIVCHGKEIFHSWTHAEKIRKKMGRSHTNRVHIYHCPYCQKYHLGNKGRKEKKHGN